LCRNMQVLWYALNGGAVTKSMNVLRQFLRSTMKMKTTGMNRNQQ
jgi:hypothetical protein